MLLQLLSRTRRVAPAGLVVVAMGLGSGEASAVFTPPPCGPSMEAVCAESADPASYCASPAGTTGDCLFGAVTAVRDAARDREAFCASNSVPDACTAALGDALQHAEAYVAPDSGCLSWLTTTGDTCAQHLTRMNASLAIPDPVTAAEDMAADLAVSIDDAGFRNAMCAANAISDMTEVTIAAGRESSLATVQSCVSQKGNGGVTYYRVTNETANSGTSNSGNYTRTYGNWLFVKSCRHEFLTGQNGSEHEGCINRVWLTHKNGSICCRGYQSNGTGRNTWVGHDYARTKGRPHCQFVEGPGSGNYQEVRTVEKFKCYYRY